MVQSEFRLADLSHQPAIVSPRATMTRFERAEQLGEMLTADDGIDHVVDTYLYEYPKMAGYVRHAVHRNGRGNSKR